MMVERLSMRSMDINIYYSLPFINNLLQFLPKAINDLSVIVQEYNTTYYFFYGYQQVLQAGSPKWGS